MHPQPYEPPVEIRPNEAEAIAWAYRLVACGDPVAALGDAIEEALADLTQAECGPLRRDHLISHGYVRGGLLGVAA